MFPNACRAAARPGHLALILACFALWLGWGTRFVWAEPASNPSSVREDFFTRPNLARFDIELGPAEHSRLERHSHEYVRATVRVDGQVLEDVGVRMKGFGTFRPLSGKPALALKFNRFKPGQEFQGLTKILLNNSAQDPTLLCEFMAAAVFQAAGVPTPRVTHARVRLNGRDLGFYVLAEAVNERFLKRHFKNPHGGLFEAAIEDVHPQMDQDNGPPSERRHLEAFVAAAASRDEAALRELLDLEEFLNFLAIEMIVANWDGYALHRNNYRIYRDPDPGRMLFIPHGLDNSLYEARLPIMPPRKSLLVKALLGTKDQREAFRRRAAGLVSTAFNPEVLTNQLQAAFVRLKAAAVNEEEIQSLEEKTERLRLRLVERAKHLVEELRGAKPAMVSFNEAGVARLTNWLASVDWNGSRVERQEEAGQPALFVGSRAGDCTASWRMPVWLEPGRYHLEGLARTASARGFASRTGGGAGLRILGSQRGSGVEGTADWTPVSHQFVVQEDCERIELIAELRAFRGKAWFDLESLRLVRTR